MSVEGENEINVCVGMFIFEFEPRPVGKVAVAMILYTQMYIFHDVLVSNLPA